MGLSLRSLTTRILPEYLPFRGLDRSKNRLNAARQGKDEASRCKRTPSRVKTPFSVRLAETLSQMTIVRTRGVTAATAILAPSAWVIKPYRPLQDSVTEREEENKLAHAPTRPRARENARKAFSRRTGPRLRRDWRRPCSPRECASRAPRPPAASPVPPAAWRRGRRR